MAGSNLSQVFISNADAVAAAGAIAKGQVGVYNVRANDFVNDAAWTTLEKIAIMQGTAGRPISSPVLDTRNIRRVDYTKFEASVAHKVVVTGTSTAGKVVTVRFVIRTAPMDYLSYYADGAGVTLDGSTYEFPLNGFHNNNHKVIPIEIAASGTLSTDLGRIKAAVEASPVLNAIMSVSVDGATYTARHPHVAFDIAFEDSEAADLAYVATVTGFVPGTGNAWQVIGDERKAQFKNGNFQRTHIPIRPEEYANATFKYDKITVEYAHNWPNSTGIAPAGELNQIVIYIGDSATALAAGDFAGFQFLFAIALATNEDQLYADL